MHTPRHVIVTETVNTKSKRCSGEGARPARGADGEQACELIELPTRQLKANVLMATVISTIIFQTFNLDKLLEVDFYLKN